MDSIFKEFLPSVIYAQRGYYGIGGFDCISISLFTEPTLSGIFSTYIPISSVEYRKNNVTHAKVEIDYMSDNDYVAFNIYDDYNKLSIVKIHKKLENEIQYAKNKAIEYRLYK